MSEAKKRSPLAAIIGNLGWPILWGTALCVLFYAFVFQGPADNPLIRRYFASHPVSYVATGMFFVGMSALVIKVIACLGQFSAQLGIQLPSEGTTRQSVDEAGELLDELEQLPPSRARTMLARRLRGALEFVERHGSAEGLEDELKYAADVDAVEQQEGFALVRIIIWATPMLGFLGTVIGITQALGDLNPQELATAIQTAMDRLLSGLYVAFDTTALALTLSIVLMFVQFIVDRLEGELLKSTDARTHELLVGRFANVGSKQDPYLLSVERMMQAVAESTEQLVVRQAQLWENSIAAANEHWLGLTRQTGTTVREALSDAIAEGMSSYAEQLGKIEEESSRRARQRWEQWQTVLSDNARTLHAQQQEMTKQTQLLEQVLSRAGEVTTLEHTLSENLQALRQAGNFDEALMSLSAAIHLLNVRLNGAATALDAATSPASKAA